MTLRRSTQDAVLGVLVAFVALAGGASGAAAATNNIFTVAGTGAACSPSTALCGDGSPATSAQLHGGAGVSLLPGGGFLVADQSDNRIRKVSPTGTITTVAGTGASCSSIPCGDGAAATAAQLSSPAGVAVTSDGGFLIADQGADVIRKVSPTGTITKVAGSYFSACPAATSSCGDGGGPNSAMLGFPPNVEPTADGGFLIGDQSDNRIRRVSGDGASITTVAGTGNVCTPTTAACGDGGPATAAQLTGPHSVAPLSDGGFLISDRSDHRIRRVSSTGIISTVAGTGNSGFSGDGGPATAADLNNPTAIAAMPDGTFLFTVLGERIRRVTPDGKIATVAGDGTTCTPFTAQCGDGGPATSAQLGGPNGLAVSPMGDFIFAEQNGNKVRFVDIAGAGGPQGPQGLPGPTGPAGAQGPTGPIFNRLLLAIVDSKLAAKHGKGFGVRFVETTTSSITAEVLKGSKTVATKQAAGSAGRNRLGLPGIKKRGHYKVRLTAKSADGQTVTDEVGLRVK